MFGAKPAVDSTPWWQGLGGGDGFKPDYAPVPSAPAAEHPSFFATGGVGRGIAGAIGDYLLQQAHMSPVYAPAMAQQRQWQQQQAQQNNLWNRFVAEQQYKATNPEPRYFEANNGDQYVIGANGQPQKIFSDPTPKVTMMAVDNGDGTKTITPFVNGVPAGQAAQPQTQRPAIGAELPDPRKRGGASPTGSRTFPW